MTGFYAYICIYVYTYINIYFYFGYFIFVIAKFNMLNLWKSEAVKSICIMKLDMSQISLVYGAALAIGFSAPAEEK